MRSLGDIPLSALHFYQTAPYACSYLPDMQARSQVAAPAFMINTAVYSRLVLHGFRRSGTNTYRPHCGACRACVPLRVPVNLFLANRSQRRAFAQHSRLQTSLHSLQDKPEYFDLYMRYQRVRHSGGGMDDRGSYLNFLLQSHVETLLVEFREPCDPAKEHPGVLRMVSVIDLLDDGLSSVYTFYDPDLHHARLGVYNILWQIELCRKLKLDFVYLGYWVKHSSKMVYKTTYRPAQGLIDGIWQTINQELL